jgi:hypothetical protein
MDLKSQILEDYKELLSFSEGELNRKELGESINKIWNKMSKLSEEDQLEIIKNMKMVADVLWTADVEQDDTSA